MNALRQLLTPLNYLRIQHDQKWLFDTLAPFGFAFIVTALMLTSSVKVLGEHGLVFYITDLIKVLVGFYIASLAAIATFQKEGIDNPLKGKQATLTIVAAGKVQTRVLSRRQFLCYLFGYLAFISIILYFLGAAMNLLPVQQLPTLLLWGVVFAYVLITSNLLSTTLLGLHFMTDSIHR